MKKQILFILDWYPTAQNNGCVFAKHLIYAIADQGYDCVVIAPRALTRSNFSKQNKTSYRRREYTKAGNEIKIYMPFYLHLSSRKQTMKMSMQHHYKSVLRTIRRERLAPDMVYGHFLYQCGLTASRVGKKLGIPSFCACGENSLRLQKGKEPYSTGLRYAGWRSMADDLSGIISVSTYNKQLLLEGGFISPDMPMEVYPNGVDDTLFHPRSKAKCREKLGFPQDAFIIAFTGAFTSNKGIDVLNEALKKCQDVYAIFLGQGPIQPDCDHILYAGRVNNKKVPIYLGAADVFVLPTKGEGCCNAIVEALSCGLPVISSSLPYNDDILDETDSIRVDVESPSEIRDAILALKQDEEMRKQLAAGAKKAGAEMNIHRRAEKIIRFMEKNGCYY